MAISGLVRGRPDILPGKVPSEFMGVRTYIPVRDLGRGSSQLKRDLYSLVNDGWN
jgi:hypothetical protein